MGLIPVYLLEEKKWKDLGVHYSSMYKTEVNERICAVYAIHGKPQNTDLIMISKTDRSAAPISILRHSPQGKTRKHHGTWR